MVSTKKSMVPCHTMIVRNTQSHMAILSEYPEHMVRRNRDEFVSRELEPLFQELGIPVSWVMGNSPGKLLLPLGPIARDFAERVMVPRLETLFRYWDIWCHIRKYGEQEDACSYYIDMRFYWAFKSMKIEFIQSY